MPRRPQPTPNEILDDLFGGVPQLRTQAVPWGTARAAYAKRSHRRLDDATETLIAGAIENTKTPLHLLEVKRGEVHGVRGREFPFTTADKDAFRHLTITPNGTLGGNAYIAPAKKEMFLICADVFDDWRTQARRKRNSR